MSPLEVRGVIVLFPAGALRLYGAQMPEIDLPCLAIPRV